MLLSQLGSTAGLVALGVMQTGTPGLHIEHTPPACLLAEKPSRIVACLVPRLPQASLRALFRAEGGTAWYSIPLRSDTPCYSGLLPRPHRATARVVYFIEAQRRGGERARTLEQEVAVVADPTACPGRVASPAPGQRAAWDAPAGEPRVPPGFEGALPPASAGRAPAPPRAATPTAPSVQGPLPAPAPPRVAPPAETKVQTQASTGGGHGLRTAALATAGLATAGLAAAGGAAIVVTQNGNGTTATPPPSGSGLPRSGVSGVYVGTETVSYSAGCVGTDDVVLNLQEASGALSGVLSFTVRTCSCCASGRGANPVAGSLSGTNLQLGTPIGFSYSGTFAGDRLSGALAGPGGVTGTWSVDKR